jgi:hypothetical protein
MQLCRLVAVGMAATAGLALTTVVPVSAGGGGGNDVNPAEGGQEVGAGAGRPGTKETVDINGKFTPSSGGSRLTCIDGTDPVYEYYGQEGWHEAFIPEPQGKPADEPEAQWWLYHCPTLQGLGADPTYTPLGWNVGGPPPPQPTAQDIVLPAWAYVKGLLENPDITMSPPMATRSVIKIPTFVAIGNPQPSTTYTASEGGVAVWIAVIPTVTLNPGEPDAGGVPCDDDGTAFDPGGGTPEAQAQGGCTHTYVHPSQPTWGGDVTITWNVTWGSNQAGQSGDFNDDVVPSVTPFDRIVDEVHGVVTDG